MVKTQTHRSWSTDSEIQEGGGVKKRKKTKKELQMRENGEKETAFSTFILKISRKLRDCCLSGLAEGKVTYGTIFSLQLL